MTWLLTTTRIEPEEFAANQAVALLRNVPAKKSPIGLLIKPAPTQAEVCPLE